MKQLIATCAMFLLLCVSGCGLMVPADPQGSLDRVEGSVLRVGASQEDRLIVLEDQEARGSLVELVTEFAAHHDATIEWTWGGEETLVTALEDGQLDVLVGGFTSDTPWSKRAGVTRGYPKIPNSDDREIVMLVPLGENRLLTALETYLDEELTQ